MTGARPDGLGAYAAVTAAYWAFMLTDGALRMLVLLHFHTLGFSPVQLANLFVLYEVAGMVTNLGAGWIAARFGLTRTLYAGLALQVLALAALARLDPGWAIGTSVAYVMAVQGASGVAKDLAKMSSKSAVKLLAPEGDGALFRWVAVLTGSKNAVKGFGFFLGAALLGLIGFKASVILMAVILAAILLAVVLFMPAGLPKGWPARRRICRGVFAFGQRQPAQRRAAVPVRRPRCPGSSSASVCSTPSFRTGARPATAPPFRRRHVHGGLGHRLRRGAGRCPAPAGRRAAWPEGEADRYGPRTGRHLPRSRPARRLPRVTARSHG